MTLYKVLPKLKARHSNPLASVKNESNPPRMGSEKASWKEPIQMEREKGHAGWHKWGAKTAKNE